MKDSSRGEADVAPAKKAHFWERTIAGQEWFAWVSAG
jgi:hypothetical protein